MPRPAPCDRNVATARIATAVPSRVPSRKRLVVGKRLGRAEDRGGSMRKVFLSGALALIGLAAPAASVLTPAAPPAAGAAPNHAAAPAGHAAPGLYHVPIIGKVTLPGLGSVLGDGLRHATA